MISFTLIYSHADISFRILNTRKINTNNSNPYLLPVTISSILSKTTRHTDPSALSHHPRSYSQSEIIWAFITEAAGFRKGKWTRLSCFGEPLRIVTDLSGPYGK